MTSHTISLSIGERISVVGGHPGANTDATVLSIGCLKIEIMKTPRCSALRRSAQAQDRGTDIRMDQPQENG